MNIKMYGYTVERYKGICIEICTERCKEICIEICTE